MDFYCEMASPLQDPPLSEESSDSDESLSDESVSESSDEGGSEASSVAGGEVPMLQFFEVKSSKDKSLLCRDGFEYTFDKVSKTDDTTEFWKCPKKGANVSYCGARIHVNPAWHYVELGENEEGEMELTRYKLGRKAPNTREHCHVAEIEKPEV